jgi:hypothetical protein
VSTKVDAITDQVGKIRDEQVRNSTKIEDIERMGRLVPDQILVGPSKQ